MRLPEERPLPDAPQMVRSILAAPPEEVAHRRTRHLVPVAAALIGAVVGGAGVFGLMRAGTTTPVVPASTPTASATESTTRGPGGAAVLTPGQTARFEHYAVTVSEFNQNGDDFAFRLHACVTRLPQVPGTEDGRVVMGLTSWSAQTTGFRTMVADNLNVGPTTYPANAKAAVGECFDGIVSAKVADKNTKVQQLDYENSLGERAAWRVG